MDDARGPGKASSRRRRTPFAWALLTFAVAALLATMPAPGPGLAQTDESGTAESQAPEQGPDRLQHDGETEAAEASDTAASAPSPTPEPLLGETSAPTEPPTETATPTPGPTASPTESAPSPPATEVPSPTIQTPEPSAPTPTADQPTPPVGNPPSGTGTAAPAPAPALRVESADPAYGRVTATGELDPSAAGVTSTTDAGGAYYVKLGAIRLRVESAAPWSGTCVAAAGPHDDGTTVAALAVGRLEWRLAGTDRWSPVPSAAAPVDNACFPERPVGSRLYVYDLRLRVDASDAPGSFAATLTFTVWPSTS
jgi:hypothetical protein